jgi:peroxiredoxin
MTTFLLSLILISVWVGFYQLVKQQGRILLRLDELERGAAVDRNSIDRNLIGGNAIGRNSIEQQESAVVEGLPAGTEFPDFEFADLSGKTHTLAEYRGQGLLLINWNFDCGFCEAIADDLAHLETDLQKQNARIVLLASGDESSNREHAAQHGLKSLILLVNGGKTPKPFEHQGTPVAYFVDEQGQVAEPFASGADQVLALAQRIASSAQSSVSSAVRSEENKHGHHPLNSERSLAESRIERNGLRAGTPAPGFRLPDLQGHAVSLDDYRNRKVLLVFSDPHCGPCDELAPHLASLYREHRNNGLAVILVGRGSEEENRDKAKKFGFEFPVVLQDKWKLSKEYGIFATPVAFLIAEDGVIARDVAVGKDAILSLAADAAKVEEKTAQ